MKRFWFGQVSHVESIAASITLQSSNVRCFICIHATEDAPVFLGCVEGCIPRGKHIMRGSDNAC